MKINLVLLNLCMLVHTSLLAQTNELQRSIPEAEGVPSEAVITLFDSLTALPHTDIHSVIVLRHGKVIGEIYPTPFAPEYRHTMYSCSKTFVGAAVGLAIADNRLRLTDRIVSFFPEQLPDSVSENLSNITVRHLLTMTSGITPDWNMRNVCTNWLSTFLAKPVKTPGVQFEYDSISTYVLSAIIQKVTGMTLLDYLKLKLFNPMNIKEVAWEISPEGIHTGGWGLHIQSESLAKFGLLLLNQGKWKGKQLLSSSWIKQMTSKQMEAGDEDYGYQMWLCDYPGAVRADGALGQYVLIMPKEDMVVVITECTLINGRNQRRLVWNKLLSAIKNQALIPGKAYARLKKKQISYTLPTVQGKKQSPLATAYANRTITLETNRYGWQHLHLLFGPKEVNLKIDDKNGTSHILPFGYKQWLTGTINAYPPYSITPVGSFNGLEKTFHVAGSYAWLPTDDLQLKVHYVDWISALDITFHFNGNNVTLTVKENFSTNETILKGKF